jgi:predicted nucleotidyltransferase
MDIRELQLPDHHQETASRFVDACQADDRILAAFLGGSYAREEADRFSDIDLYFVTTDEAYEEFLVEKENFVHQLGEPLFLEDFGVPHGYCFMLSNTTEGEFWFGSESHFKNMYSGPYKVLMDKKNILVGEAFPALIEDHAQQLPVLQRQIDWFWHELSHFIKAIGRKQLWFAYGQLESMRRMCTILARLDHNFSDALLEEDEPYFKIEQALPTKYLSPLQTTFCPMEYDAMLQAASVLCRFYKEIAPDLAKAHNLAYQTDLERMWIGRLKELSQASSRQ